MKRWCVMAFCAALHVPAAAAGAADEPAALDAIVVTATRTTDDALTVPAAVDVLDAQDIGRAQPRIDLAEALDRVPGVVVRDRQNQAQDLQISVRGFGARATFGVRGVRLYTDGIPATMPDGQGQVSHFALQSAARIEVLRGPFSALYGNASGGVISLFSAKPPARPQLRAGYTAGSFGLARSLLSLRTPWQTDGVDGLLMDITRTDSEGFRRHSAAQRDNGQVTFKGDFGSGYGRYVVTGDWLDLAALDPQGLTAEQLEGDRRASSSSARLFNTRKTVRQQQLGAHLEHALSDAHAFAFTAYGGQRETFQVLSIPVFVQENPLQGGGVIDLDRGYHGADARWRWDTEWRERPLSLTFGYAREVSDEWRRGYENFIGDSLGVVGALRREERNRVTGDDIYVQADWQPTDRWRINAGARSSRIRFGSDDRYITAENPDDSGALEHERISPVAGVLFRVTPGLSVYANAGGGFETPTFSELAYRSDGASGLNTALRPAVSSNMEAGMRARHGGTSWSAAVFHSRTEDEITVIANDGGRSVYGNAGVSVRRGAELAADIALAPRLQLAVAYTLLDAEYREGFSAALDGRDIPGLARHVAWSELAWSPLANLDVLLEGRFVDRVPVNDENTAFAAAHASFDLALEQRFFFAGMQWRGFLRLNNLFDREHVGSVIVNEGNGRYYEPAPGRNGMIGLSATASFE